jgi:MoaA/NifB/PqqE/SkfB family radical SAM enzyme
VSIVPKKLLVAAIKNVARARYTDSTFFDPVLPTMYVTPLCNLQCTYCADWGLHKNSALVAELPTREQLERTIAILAEECQALYFTGGEPLMRPDIAELAKFARSQGIVYLAMNTNGLLLHVRPEVLSSLDNLVISLDGLDEVRDYPALQAQPRRRQRILDNIRWAAGEQKARGFSLTLTCVVRPGRVQAAHEVMEFAQEIGAEFSIQHLTVGSRASPELKADPAFRTFVNAMLEARRAGRGISGSEVYLTTTRDHRPFGCTPTAVPHVDHLGRLAYPCREIGDQVYVDLLAAGSLRAAMKEGARLYGPPPGDCSLCPDRCYAETSTLIRNPSAALREVSIHLSKSRLGKRARALLPVIGRESLT